MVCSGGNTCKSISLGGRQAMGDSWFPRPSRKDAQATIQRLAGPDDKGVLQGSEP